MLTGRFTESSQFQQFGFISTFPRFQEEALEHNLQLVKTVQDLAKQKGCSSAQLAISWVQALSERDGLPVIIPIPGATTASRVMENSALVRLSEGDIKAIMEIVENFKVSGGRYPQGAPTNT